MSNVRGTTLALIVCLLASRASADKVRILEDPREASQARVDIIQQAKRSVDAQYYIVGKDYYTLAGLTLLRDAARRGCRVRLIIDAFSDKVPKSVHAHLQREQVEVRRYHPFNLAKPGEFLRRMHDKGVQVDQQRMVLGGRNIGGDYFGYAKRNFIDRDIYVEGRAAKQSAAYFNELWNSREVAPVKVNDPNGALASEGERLLDEARAGLAKSKIVRLNTKNAWSPRAREVGSVAFLHDVVGKKNVEPGIAQMLRRELLRTRHSVLLETPYLVPTKELYEDIRLLKARGVKRIEIVTNSLASNDSALVQLGYETSKKKLMRLGVELWEYNGPDTLHAKSAVLDDRLALVGSFNIDPRSQHLNSETAVVIRDTTTARQLARYINAHKADCTRVTPEQPMAPSSQRVAVAQRVKLGIFRLLLPLIRGQL
jgi:putative cardiolipin synthase